jgi:outer membrane protein assembly factor BamB
VAASLYLTQGTVVTALNAADGSTRWREQVAVASDPITSVAAMRTVVYLATEDGTVSALDAASGALRWCARAQAVINSTSAGTSSLLAVAQGVVYVTRFNAVTALDASDGSQRWQTTLGGDSFHNFYTLQLDAGLLVITLQQLMTTNGTVTAPSLLVALDASTGSTRWSLQSQKGQFDFGLTLAQGTVYVVDSIGSACSDNFIDAVREQDGKLLWQVHQEGCGTVLPASGSGLVFTVPVSRGGLPHVYAFDGATGARRWVAPQSSSAVSGPLVDAGVVYVVLVGPPPDGPEQLQALRASSGAALWTWPGVLSLFAAANGAVYVAGGTALVALSSAGKQLWQAPNLVEPATTLVLPVSGS